MAGPASGGNVHMDLAGAATEAVESLVLVWARAEEAAHERVSPSQLRALFAVHRRGSLSLGALAADLGAVPSSASRLCDRLVAAGLLDRRASEDNRRKVTLTLTGNGRRLLQHLEDQRRGDLGRLLEQMSPTARRALLRGLRELGETVRRVSAGPGAGPSSILATGAKG
ncbi:MAG: MarR family winged helix-turn-helix transcriptional regulator [Acidimicrobiales bacterium]